MEEPSKNQSRVFFDQDVVIYPSFGANTPNVLAIRVKRETQTRDLPLGQYIIIFLESDSELKNFDNDLIAAGRLDFFWNRSSIIAPLAVYFATYEPAAKGWPWLFVGCLPVGDGIDFPSAELSRGRYFFDAFDTESQLHTHIKVTLSTFNDPAFCARWKKLPGLQHSAIELLRKK